MGRENNRLKQLSKLLPEGWQEKAKELGALKRSRKIKTPEELLRMVLIYLTEGESMAGTSALTNLTAEQTMSKIAVFKRIQKCGNWLQWICTNIYRKAGLLVQRPRWLKNKSVLLLDGSKDIKTGEKQQAFMLHYSIELFTLANREFLITDGKTGEKMANFQKFAKDDIAVADRIYGTAQGIAHLRKHEADYVLRLRAGALRICDDKGEKIDPIQRFSGLTAWNYGEFIGSCRIEGEDAPVPVRVCAVRKDVFAQWDGLQRLKKERGCKRGGKPVSEVQQEYNKYIIVLTSLGKEVSAEQVLQLYRMRWQIEIAFKRLKSLFCYNQMPARKPENIKTWFYGKLLLAALSETLVNSGRFPPCTGGGKRKRR